MPIENKDSWYESRLLPFRNVHRTVGAMLSGEDSQRSMVHVVCRKIVLKFIITGSAGQSFGAFLVHGITLTLEGDANDYAGNRFVYAG